MDTSSYPTSLVQGPVTSLSLPTRVPLSTLVDRPLAPTLFLSFVLPQTTVLLLPWSLPKKLLPFRRIRDWCRRWAGGVNRGGSCGQALGYPWRSGLGHRKRVRWSEGRDVREGRRRSDPDSRCHRNNSGNRVYPRRKGWSGVRETPVLVIDRPNRYIGVWSAVPVMCHFPITYKRLYHWSYLTTTYRMGDGRRGGRNRLEVRG